MKKETKTCLPAGKNQEKMIAPRYVPTLCRRIFSSYASLLKAYKSILL